MRFSYRAFDTRNTLHRGTVEAATLRDATNLLLEKGWFIKKISPAGRVNFGFLNISFGGISLLEKMLMAKHLSMMLKSGITMSEALAVIGEQAPSARFRRIVSVLGSKVRSGQSLGNACAAFPRVFDPLFINVIKAGEQSGTLEENLLYLAGELEDRLELRRTVVAASFYPAIVFTATAGLCGVLAWFVLPRIKQLFTTLKFELPLSTKTLLFIADIVDQYGFAIFIGLIVVAISVRVAIIFKPIKVWWHWVLIHVPVAGIIVVNYNLALMSRMLGVLLRSGLTIDQSLSISAQVIENLIYRKKIADTLLQIQRGTSLSAALSLQQSSRRYTLFPLLMLKMVTVAERTGKYDESFEYLADFYEKEVKGSVRTMTTILEPVLLLIVGSIVGFVAVSVIAPIYQVTGQFRR